MSTASSVRDWAALYISLGMEVIPLVPRGKDCWHDDWPKKVFQPEHFDLDSNIGIKPVNGLVTLDIDSAEAVSLADALLPETGAVWGRKTKPRAKRLYRCAELDKTRQFKDGDPGDQPAMLLEVRVGPGFQDVAPPSIHPSGERLAWIPGPEPGTPAVVAGPDLLRSARLLAVAAVCARHYPPEKKRHDWTLGLAGVLRKLDVAGDDATRVLRAVVEHVKDGKASDRLTELRSTYARGEDDSIAAFKTLESEAGAGFVMTLRKLLGEEGAGLATSRLQQLNAKHALLFDQSGKMLLMTETPEDELAPVRFSTPETIKLLYTDQVAVGTKANGTTPVMRNVGEVWLQHPKRRQYKGIELAPNGNAREGYYNLWRGFSVEPKPGDWSGFREHVKLVAGDNQEHADYITAWLAQTVQHPDDAIGVSLAFRGGQGTGKSTFATWFGRLFGPHFLHLDSEHRLLGNFNSHLMDKILVFADEAVWAGGKQGLGALKRMVTEKTLAIERKGIDTVNVRNMLHLLIASNETWFVPKELDDRRFAVFGVSRRKQNDHAFFAAVYQQLFHEGGLAALLYDLLELRSPINLKVLPETEESQTQKSLTASPTHQWWMDELQEGSLWNKDNLVGEDRSTHRPNDYRFDRNALYARYVDFVKNSRIDPVTRNALGVFLRGVLPGDYPRNSQSHTGFRSYVVPPLVECRAYYKTAVFKGFTWTDGQDAGRALL